MRKLALALALLLAFSFVLINRQNLSDFLTTLQHGQPVWIGLALLVQIARLFNVTAQHRAAYQVVGLTRGIRELLPLVLISIFLNITAPIGGASGMAAFIADGRRRGYSSARVTIVSVLFILFDYIAFCVVLTITLVVLFRRNILNATSLIPSALMFGAAIGLSAIVVLGMRSGHALERLLLWAVRVVNGLVRPVRADYLYDSGGVFNRLSVSNCVTDVDGHWGGRECDGRSLAHVWNPGGDGLCHHHRLSGPHHLAAVLLRICWLSNQHAA